MRTLALLAMISISGVIASFANPKWSDLLLLAGPCTIASLLLIMSRLSGRTKAQNAPARKAIVIDGSNVMYWKNDTPKISTVREVVNHLTSLGFETGVMFDANAGYVLSGSYQHDGKFGDLLGLPTDRIMVVPKGTPADPYILKAARDLGARIVTNDRYRDWMEDFPEIAEPDYLIKGNYTSGKLWLSLSLDENTGASSAK
jgi:hypothetical protein